MSERVTEYLESVGVSGTHDLPPIPQETPLPIDFPQPPIEDPPPPNKNTPSPLS